MKEDGGRGEPRKEADYRMAVEAARRAADLVGRARRDTDLGAGVRLYKAARVDDRIESSELGWTSGDVSIASGPSRCPARARKFSRGL